MTPTWTCGWAWRAAPAWRPTARGHPGGDRNGLGGVSPPPWAARGDRHAASPLPSSRRVFPHLVHEADGIADVQLVVDVPDLVPQPVGRFPHQELAQVLLVELLPPGVKRRHGRWSTHSGQMGSMAGGLLPVQGQEHPKHGETCWEQGRSWCSCPAGASPPGSRLSASFSCCDAADKHYQGLTAPSLVSSIHGEVQCLCGHHSPAAAPPPPPPDGQRSKTLTCPASSGSRGVPRCPPPPPGCGRRP